MHIKQVIIQGFRTYKNETICQPFSPKQNVIVGRNGSGKSNFFFAIRFVLSDMYTSLSNQERAKLLHGEGVGMSVMSAYVELVFDNSDNRIPIEREEVTLRRSIGLKKDEYFLDSKHVTKQEVMNLLESSGFSRSNPYYIVQQGKITELATMKDSQRLNLLKEVAGTGVYDARRLQSTQILEDTKTKKERIEEVLNYIEERLAELEDEKDELKEYQELDRCKRSIEYTIYDKELKMTREALETLDLERVEEAQRRSKNHSSQNESASKELTDQLTKLKNEIERLQRERLNLESDRKEQIQEHAKLELDVGELEGAVKNEKQTESSIKKSLVEVRNMIRSMRDETEKILPDMEEAAGSLHDLELEQEKAVAKQNEIFSRQTRTTQFNTAEERDDWIDGEMKSLQELCKSKQSAIGQSEAEVDRLQQELEQAKEDLQERSTLVEKRKVRIEQIKKEVQNAKKEKDDYSNMRKKIWHDEAALDNKMSDMKGELTKAERALYATTSKAKSNGLEVVRQLKAEGMDGIYGKLIDLIQCDPRYQVAVEVTAMDSMFNVVVKDDDVASKIINYINTKKIDARVTLLPLNRLKSEAPKLPESSAKEFLAIVKKIKCDDHIRPAVYHVFGKTIVCRDLDVATRYSGEQNIDAVTLDGDKVSKKGSMHGGFYDTQASKMDLAAKLRKISSEFDSAEEESKKLKVQSEELGQNITNALARSQKLENEKERLRQNHDNVQADEAQMRVSIEKLENQLESETSALEQLNADLVRSNERIASLSEERGTSLESEIDTESKDELKLLTNRIAELTPQIAEARASHEALVQRHDEIDRQLKLNLEKQEKKLVRQQEEFRLADRKLDYETKKVELKAAKAAVEETDAMVVEIEQTLLRITTEAQEITSNLDDAKSEERRRMTSDADADKRLEKILNKRAIHLEKQEEMMRKIRDLGALPKDFEKYANMDLKKLYKQLSGVNKKLKDPKYRQVNKKALDQYISFSEQRDALVRRKSDQDNADESIKDLIQVLDNQKDEAIERTFKQVSMYFKQVFRELVPNGEGSLVMQKRGDVSEEEQDAIDSETQIDKRGRIEQYIGVAVRVSFTGKATETQLLQQLSGGQRTIVALALIFAIQRCDPAPFYLFDEIDAALDAAHRTAVATMIARLSTTAQFIVTTFRPEMVNAADQWYGVTFKNKVSKIGQIPRETALEFIEDEAGGK